MKWFLYCQYYVQPTQPLPDTKIQASSMTANTMVMTYQNTGTLYAGSQGMSSGCDDNKYY